MQATVSLWYPQLDKERVAEGLRPKVEGKIKIPWSSFVSLIRCTNIETTKCLFTGKEMDREVKIPDSKMMIRYNEETNHAQLYYTGDVCLYTFKLNKQLPAMVQLYSLITQYFQSCYIERSYNQMLGVIIRDNLYYPGQTEKFIEKVLGELKDEKYGFASKYPDPAIYGQVLKDAVELYQGIKPEDLGEVGLVDRLMGGSKGGKDVEIKKIDRELKITGRLARGSLSWTWTDKYLWKDPDLAKSMFDDLIDYLGPEAAKLALDSDPGLREELQYPYEVLVIVDSIIDCNK